MSSEIRHAALIRQTTQQAVRHGQVESYGPHLPLYRHGIYSNTPSLWSHSPDLIRQQPGPYRITVYPQQGLKLAILDKTELQQLLEACQYQQHSIYEALEQLCRQLTTHTAPVGLDGIASYPLDPGPHYQHIIIFRPLEVLRLYDLAPL